MKSLSSPLPNELGSRQGSLPPNSDRDSSTRNVWHFRPVPVAVKPFKSTDNPTTFGTSQNRTGDTARPPGLRNDRAASENDSTSPLGSFWDDFTVRRLVGRPQHPDGIFPDDACSDKTVAEDDARWELQRDSAAVPTPIQMVDWAKEHCKHEGIFVLSASTERAWLACFPASANQKYSPKMEPLADDSYDALSMWFDPFNDPSPSPFPIPDRCERKSQLAQIRNWSDVREEAEEAVMTQVKRKRRGRKARGKEEENREDQALDVAIKRKVKEMPYLSRLHFLLEEWAHVVQQKRAHGPVKMTLVWQHPQKATSFMRDVEVWEEDDAAADWDSFFEKYLAPATPQVEGVAASPALADGNSSSSSSSSADEWQWCPTTDCGRLRSRSRRRGARLVACTEDWRAVCRLMRQRDRESRFWGQVSMGVLHNMARHERSQDSAEAEGARKRKREGTGGVMDEQEGSSSGTKELAAGLVA